MHRLFLAGLLLRTCLAITLRTNAWVDHELEACSAAMPGEWCHAALTWAKQSGYERHPEWFPGNASQYSPRDFQTLLHQLGQAECSRPCPQDSAGARSALGLSQLEGSAVIDETYGLSEDEFAAVMESSWKPKPGNVTLAAQGADKDHKASCEDAQLGSMCYHATAWLQAEGLAKHPSWYPSLSGDSTLQDVQSVLYALGKAGCPKPCETRVAQTQVESPGDRVLEIDSNGRQVLSEAYELSAPTECGDTVEGEWCYLSIMWLKNTGLQSHPDWYPKLTRESSMGDFQTSLHDEGKVGCPLPCSADSTEAKEEGDSSEAKARAVMSPSEEKARAVMSPSAVRVNAEMEQCENAKRGSRCDNEITRIINVALPAQPEAYPTLAADSSREEVQEYLYLRDSYVCGMPCPTVKIVKRQRPRRVKKNAEDMTEQELTRFLNQEWDGYVDADEYTNAVAADGAPAKENALEEYTNAVSANGPPARTPPPAPGGCRDASVGELCYQAVTWARRVGILERPKWYVGLSENSTAKEFQAYLHKTRGSLCQMPCPDAAPAAEGDAMKEENVTADATPLDPATEDSVMANDTAAYAEPALGRPDAQPEEPVQANSTVEEPAPQPEAATVEAETISSDEALPVVGDSTEEVNSTAEEDAQANSTVEEPALQAQLEETVQANSTVEEPAPQPEVATVETETISSDEALPEVDDSTVEAEVDPRGWLPIVDMDGQVADSAAEEANHTEEADHTGEVDTTEGANRTEEPAPQPEVDTDPQEALRRENERLRAEVEALRKPASAAVQTEVEAPAPQLEAQTSQEGELLPWVDGAGLEANASAEEAQAQAEEAQVQVSAPAEEVQNAAAEVEQNATTA